MDNFHIELRANGVAVLRIDVAGSRTNAMDGEVQAELAAAVHRLACDPAVRAIVVASATPDMFSAGGDLVRLYGFAREGERLPAEARDVILASLHLLNGLIRELESCGKPSAAAIEGLALGGGLEIAMGTHRRFVADRPDIRLGLPEIKVGLIPGAGGTQRLPRLIGVDEAVAMMLSGAPVAPREALRLGLADELVAPDTALEKAVAWAEAAGDSVQRWDRPGYALPEGSAGAVARLRQRWKGDFVAAEMLIDAVVDGIALPIEAAVAVEERCFLAALLSPQAAPIMRTCFFSPRALRKAGHDREWDRSYLERLRAAHDDEATPESEDGAAEIKLRLLCRQAIAALRCLEAGEIAGPEAGDVAAVEELGFPVWTGGPFAWIDAMGAEAFVETCDRLVARFGPRFEAPALARRMAAEGATFYD